MAGRDMLMQVVVKLRDELSRGIDGAMKKLIALGNLTKRVSTASVAALNAIGTKLGSLGIGTGIGLQRGLESFIKIDAGLRDVGITLGKSGAALEKFVAEGISDLEKLAITTGQTSEVLTGMWNVLAQAGGLSEEAQRSLLVPTAKATTAANADPVDMAKLVVALYKNTGLKSQADIELAIAHLIQGGKLGSVELKNMASDLPTILAYQNNLGLKGMKSVDTAVANVEISRNTVGTPGEAATNYKDFLASVNAHHTRKRFADHGVDLPGVLADAAAKGINPVDAVLQKVGKIINQPKLVADAIKRAKVKGFDDKGTLKEVESAVEAAVKAKGLGELFVNQQTLGFLIARELGKAEYKEMIKTLAGTDTGVTETDRASRMAGPESKQRVAGERIEQIGRRLGSALAGIFDAVDWAAQKIQRFIAALDELSPKIVDLAAQTAALVSSITGLVFIAKMFGGAAPAAATAGAGVAGAAAGAAGAGGAGGLIGRLLGAARVGTGLGLGAFAAWKTWQGLDAIGEAAGSKNWTPKAPDEMADLRARLKATEATIAKLRTNSRDPDSLGPVLAPHEARAADLRGRIAAGERAGVERPLQPLPRPSVQAPPQKVEIDGNITVKVDGPGTVTSASSSTPGVTIGGGGDRGSNGSRP